MPILYAKRIESISSSVLSQVQHSNNVALHCIFHRFDQNPFPFSGWHFIVHWLSQSNCCVADSKFLVFIELKFIIHLRRRMYLAQMDGFVQKAIKKWNSTSEITKMSAYSIENTQKNFNTFYLMFDELVGKNDKDFAWIGKVAKQRNICDRAIFIFICLTSNKTTFLSM